MGGLWSDEVLILSEVFFTMKSRDSRQKIKQNERER